MTTTMTSKGQIVIPKGARVRRGLRPGDDFEVLLPDGSDDVVLRRIQISANEGMMEALRRMRGLKVPQRRKRFARRPPEL